MKIDRQGALWPKAKLLVVSGAVLLTTGLALSSLEALLWKAVKASRPEHNGEELQGALGVGLLWGLLGGFRSIIADFVWIRSSILWEKKDLLATETTIHLTTVIDPRPIFFWLNGTRIIAYDMPHWRVQQLGGQKNVPEAVRIRIRREQAKKSLRFIDRAMQFHPESSLLLIEQAMIYLNQLDDKETAAEYYKRAWQMQRAPYYAARIYAELLKQLGRGREAYAWYRQLYPTLPEDDIDSQKRVILERIRELEDDLDLSPEQRLVEE